MDIDNPQTYEQLLVKLAAINIFFVILMTSVSFLIFISYDAALWHSCPKYDIFKVFFQAMRFNLSIAGYFNIPIFVFLMFFLTFRPSHITKFIISILKSFYLSAFVSSFSMLTLFHMLKNISGIEKMITSEYFSKLALIFAGFDHHTFMMMLIVMSVLFLIIVIFFIVFFKLVLISRQYNVDDHQRAMVATAVALVLCIIFAKGKIIGHLTVRDCAVTPIIQLNDYAIVGPYKIFDEIRKFDISNIYFTKDLKKFTQHGMVISDMSDDAEKVKQLLYRFNPKQEEL
jgi:hypothetical protein